MSNIFSVDLEDWFCSLNMNGQNPSANWSTKGISIIEPTLFILNQLEQHKVKATFFVIAWLAKELPELIQEIRAQGHEIALHSYDHRDVSKITPDEFKADISRSLEILNKIIPDKIIGYRAPNFSINQNSQWVYDILAEFGFCYDSSEFPMKIHPNYGTFKGLLSPYKKKSGIIEFPLSFANYSKIRIPCGGGGYFRLYPYRVFRSLANNCIKDGRPLIFYTHPFEYNPNMQYSFKKTFDNYRFWQNRKNIRSKLSRLLSDFEFTSFGNYIKAHKINDYSN